MSRPLQRLPGPAAVAGVAALAFAARLAAILLLGGLDPTGGSYEHGAIARELALGNGFRLAFYGDPALTSHQAPLVSWTLAGAYLVFGVESPAAHLAWQLLAALLGAAACALLVLLGTSLISARGGLIAGLAGAFYPPLVYAPIRIQTVSFTIPLLLAIVWLALRYRQEGRARWAALFGLCGGVGMLAEPIIASPLLVLGAWMFWIAWRQEGPLAALLCSGAAVAALLAVILPWTARNLAVHGRFVLVKDSFPYAFWQGNNPHASGTDKLLVERPGEEGEIRPGTPLGEEARLNDLRREARSVDETLPAEFIAKLHSEPTEIGRMDLFGERAWSWVAANPLAYARLCGRRATYLLWFDPTNPRSSSIYYRASYLFLLALSAPGALLALRQGRRWAPLFLAAGAQAAVHVLVIMSARFRLPLEACMILLAAAALPSSLVLPAALPGSLEGADEAAPSSARR